MLHTLATAIQLKRKLIEQLRPSLLDNLGLFAAYHWHVRKSCGEAGVAYSDRYPSKEPPFTSDALIGLYRILQEKLAVTLKQPSIESLEINVTTDNGALKISLAHDAPVACGTNDATAMAAIRHRIRLLGGKMTIRTLRDGSKVLTTHILFSSSLLPI